jgi:hypothetical protein
MLGRRSNSPAIMSDTPKTPERPIDRDEPDRTAKRQKTHRSPSFDSDDYIHQNFDGIVFQWNHVPSLDSVAAKLLRSKIKKHDTLQLNGITDWDSGLTTLLQNFKGLALSLNGLKSLTPEAADALGEGIKKHTALHLNGLTECHPAMTTLLENFKGLALSLDGLKSLDSGAAKALGSFVTKHTAGLHLNGITKWDSAMTTLVKNCSASLLSLNGLTTLVNIDAEALLPVTKHTTGLHLNRITKWDYGMTTLVKNFNGDFLSLNGLESLDSDAVKALGTFVKKPLARLHLNGLTECHPAMTTLLENFNGDFLSLSGLESLDSDAAKALGSFVKKRLHLNGITKWDSAMTTLLDNFNGYELSLNGLESLDSGAAKGLRSFVEKPPARLHLNGITECHPVMKTLLENFNGDFLSLDGLRSLTPDAVEAWCKCSDDLSRGIIKLEPAKVLDILHCFKRTLSLKGLKSSSMVECAQVTGSFDALLKTFLAHLVKLGLSFDPMDVKRYISSLLAKPFVILAGQSGTGKTQLAFQFAKWLCPDESQYLKVAVEADWTSTEKIFGYLNGLTSKYVSTESLDLIVRASANSKLPYFLILDEMNLSHVERYFSNMLSAIELPENGLKFEGREPIKPLPANLFIVGTINVDETTYQFSPKVLDRANVIEIRAPDDMITTWQGGQEARRIDIAAGSGNEFQTMFLSKTKEVPDAKIKAARLKPLEIVFTELKTWNREFAHRTLQEIHRLAHFLIQCEFTDEIIMDIVMIQKILPKLHGTPDQIETLVDGLMGLCGSRPLSLAKLQRMSLQLKSGMYASFFD